MPSPHGLQAEMACTFHFYCYIFVGEKYSILQIPHSTSPFFTQSKCFHANNLEGYQGKENTVEWSFPPRFWLVILKFLWYQLLIPKFMVRALWFIHEKQICSPLGLQSTGYKKTLFWHFKYAHKTDQGNDRKAQVWKQCILPQTGTSSAPEITKSCIPARSVQRQNPCPAENPAGSHGVLPKLMSPSPRRQDTPN